MVCHHFRNRGEENIQYMIALRDVLNVLFMFNLLAPGAHVAVTSRSKKRNYIKIDTIDFKAIVAT
jgi:hypothetical protein